MNLSPSTRIAVISQRVDYLSTRNEVRDCLDQSLVDWLLEASVLPYPVPNTIHNSVATTKYLSFWLDHINPDLVILSGGNNVGECMSRDLTEHFLLNWASERSCPLLGICRGMQLMGIAAGGFLRKIDGHVRTFHNLQNGWPGRVNSYHDYCFTEIPPNYSILSRSSDGAIEAMRHDFFPWEGWMWHPERPPSRPQDTLRLRMLLES